MRRNATSQTLFADTHIDSGGELYAAPVPMLRTTAPYLTAVVTRSFGDSLYGGLKPSGGDFPTTGLAWDRKEVGLRWTFGQKYNTDNQAAPTQGVTRFEGGKIFPYRVKLQACAPQLWQRGGSLKIPDWFADKFTRMRGYAVGFGGYYSIFDGGSYGPSLIAPTPDGKGMVLLGYPRAHPCPRPATYHHATPGTWMGDDPTPDGGTWNAGDEIGGENFAAGAAWVSTPTHHGVLFFASLASGRIAYEDGGVQVQGRSDYLYTYDPASLVAVAEGRAQPWEVRPATIYRFPNHAPGLGGRAAGVAYDQVGQRLYVCFAQSYGDPDDMERYPSVSVFSLV